MKGLARASGARVRGLGAALGPWLSPSVGSTPLSDFSVLISSTRNQPSGPQSCEEAQMGQRQSMEPKVRLRRGQAASSAVGADRGLAAVSGSKGTRSPEWPAKPQGGGPPQHEAACGPASPGAEVSTGPKEPLQRAGQPSPSPS